MKNIDHDVRKLTLLDIAKGLIFIIVFFGAGIFLGNIILMLCADAIFYIFEHTENKIILFVLFVILCITYGFFAAISKSSEYGFSSWKFLSILSTFRKSNKE